MQGLVLMNRQNDRNRQGDIREFLLESSDDGSSWQQVLRGELLSTLDPQTVLFPELLHARYLRLTALSGFGTDPSSALAEIAVIYMGTALEEGASESARVPAGTQHHHRRRGRILVRLSTRW